MSSQIYKPQTTEELKKLVNDESIHLGDIDTSAIDCMAFLFQDSTRRDFSGIESWNVSNVTNMSYMFAGAKSFNQPLDSWDTSKVTDMAGMFYNATSFNQPIGAWNVESVTDMSFMFYGAEKFCQVLDNWNVCNVTSMGYMFEGAHEMARPPKWANDRVR